MFQASMFDCVILPRHSIYVLIILILCTDNEKTYDGKKGKENLWF